MARLNLTLDEATFLTLDRHARKAGDRVATHARQLIGEALARRERLERRKVWAEAYGADRADARRLAADLESASLDLLDDEDA
jgi:hypothetical protein